MSSSFEPTSIFAKEELVALPMERIRRLLWQHHRLDLSLYRHDFVQQCLEWRISLLTLDCLESYAERMAQQPEEMDQFLATLSIGVSSFFRNPPLFEQLEHHLLPALFHGREKKFPTLRLWCAGCSRGEEVYSLALLIGEMKKKFALSHRVQIFATDTNPLALNHAQKGCYPLEHLGLIPPHLHQPYLLSIGTQEFQITDDVREMVSFSQHDLVSDECPVPGECVYTSFDIILCRNVLLYYVPPIVHRVLENFHTSLGKNGILVLGESESIPDVLHNRWIPVDGANRIYRKREL